MPSPKVVIAIVGLLAFAVIVVFEIRRALRAGEAPSERLWEALPRIPCLKLRYPPPRFELLPCEDIPWSNGAETEGRAQRLQALGFQDAGRYQNSELRKAYGWAFVHPQAGVTVVLMTFAGQGDYFEMATHYADGTSFALANAPLIGVLPRAPHWTVQRVEESDPASVYERLLRERPEKPLDPDQVDDFAIRYPARWARIADWLNVRGGYTEDEIRVVCGAQGLNPTDEMIADCRERIRSQALRGIEAVVWKQFLASFQLSEAETLKLRPWTVVVHDRLEFDMLLPVFERRWESTLHTTMPDRCAVAEDVRALGRPAREAFVLLNERMPGPQFQVVARFTEPLDADLYTVDASRLPPGLQ
jgi:hypothetical protein